MRRGQLRQNEPISLSTEVTTTYYTDGSSQSNSRMLFYVGEGSAQRMGFIGARLNRTSTKPLVQANYKSFRAWGLASNVGLDLQRHPHCRHFRRRSRARTRPK